MIPFVAISVGFFIRETRASSVTEMKQNCKRTYVARPRRRHPNEVGLCESARQEEQGNREQETLKLNHR